MKKGEHYKYRICESCNKELPLNRETFKRYNGVFSSVYHKKCRSCEERELHEKHWNGDKLICMACGGSFSVEDFNKTNSCLHRNSRDKRCKWCKTKLNAISRNKKRGEDAIERVVTERFLACKLRANRHGMSFGITRDIIKELIEIQENKCAMSGITMTYSLGMGRTNTNMSVDRINSSEGYTKDNIQLVCMAVNQMKSDLSKEELLMFCDSIVTKNKSLKINKL